MVHVRPKSWTFFVLCVCECVPWTDDGASVLVLCFLVWLVVLLRNFEKLLSHILRLSREGLGVEHNKKAKERKEKCE